MKKRYIIFDFDGTLVNTNDIILETWKATLRRYLGHELSDREILSTFGETLKHSVEELIPDGDYEEIKNYYRDYQDSNYEGKVYVFPGVCELLTALKEQGCKIGIATSRTKKSLMNYLDVLGIGGYMDEIVSMEDVERHKPDPESVTKLLEKFGASPGEAVMIGDSRYDIGCANAAGVESVLVGWSHEVEESDLLDEAFAPTHRISDPSELLQLI